MTREFTENDHQEFLEYHGSTSIERIIKLAGIIIQHDWLNFDTVEEAQEYFYSMA